MKTFAEVLQQKIEENKGKGRFQRLYRLLTEKNSKRKERLLKRLEDHARLHLANEGIEVEDDWSAIEQRDWSTFFQSLLKFLTALIPLIMPFLKKN